MAMLRAPRVPFKIPGTQSGTWVFHINDGYVYQKNNKTDNAIYYKCAKYEGQKCLGRAIYRRGLGFESKVDTHNHDPDIHEPQERELRKKILDRCKAPEYKSFRAIINQEREGYPMAVKSQVTLARMRPAMQRARRSTFPEPPQSIQELSEILRQNPIITMTKDGAENFYAASVTATDGSHCIIFASRRMLRFAARNMDYLFGDGTFKVLPSLPDMTEASQVYTVVGNWNHHIVPIAVVIMSRRTESAYDAVLQALHDFMNGAPHVTKIVTDFEVGAQNSWATNFPDAELQGCFFHVVRAFIRYAKEELHMTAQLRADGPVRRIVKLCCALPLLPRQYFQRGFGVIMNEAHEEGRRIYRIVRPFLDYVLRSWINNRQRNRLMSVFGSRHRTNNTCESFHRQLNKYMVIPRPNIYDFIGAIATIEDAANIDAYGLEHGHRVGRGRKSSAIANDRRLRRLAHDLREAGPALRNNAILRYLRAAVYTFENAYARAIDE